MDADTFATARAALVQGRLKTSPLNRVTTDWQPRDLVEAYALQAAVAEDLGGSGGWKVSAVTPAQQQSLGLDRPVGGALLKRWLLRADGRPVPLRLADFVAPRLECEFAFEMARDLPARTDRPYTREEVVAAVACLRPGVEIVDSRLPSGSGAFAEIADAFNNGAFIVGETVAAWAGIDLGATGITLSVSGVGTDGKVDTSELATGDGRAVLAGDPFGAVVLFANAQPGAGPGLRAGDIVTTGSCTGAPDVPGTGRYVAEFAGLGRIEFSFA